MESYGKTATRALRRGFTILELMIVISVIAILATLVTKAAQSSIKQARDKESQVMAQAIRVGIANYHAQYGKWPGVIEDYADSGRAPSGGSLSASEADKVVQTIISESGNGNPLIDASGLFVASQSAAGAKRGHGLNFGEARRRGMPLGDMAFGYQRTQDGVFRRFRIKYDPTNDTVSVERPE